MYVPIPVNILTMNRLSEKKIKKGVKMTEWLEFQHNYLLTKMRFTRFIENKDYVA